MADKFPAPPDPGVFPQRITLELTNKCNISCVFCPRKNMTSKIGFLDYKLATTLLDEMSHHLPVTLVPFFRGEPLLHPEWYEILSHAKKNGIGPIQLTTNGMLLDKKAVHNLFELGLDFISFSLDSVNRKLYEKTRRGANYQQVVDNILFLIQEKERLGLKLPEIQVSAVETPQLQVEIEKFIDYWKPKVDRVRIYIEHSQSGHPGSIDQAIPDFDERLPCFKLFTDMVIYWNGEVAICNHDWMRDQAEPLGDLNHSTIAEVWRSEAYKNFRKNHFVGGHSGCPPCDHCDHWKMYYLPEGYLGRVYSRP